MVSGLALPTKVRITEVSARDGLQSARVVLTPRMRAVWVSALLSTGVDEVEAGSFVNPRAIPQMEDSSQVFSLLSPDELSRSWAMVMNERGLADAKACGAQNILLVLSATESHSRDNLGKDVNAALEIVESLHKNAQGCGLRTRAAISQAFTPQVAGGKLREICQKLAGCGVNELTLCDTLGDATPNMVADVVERIADLYPVQALGMHMHDSFGFAMANVHAGLKLGISRFDSAILGLGGCPNLCGSKGNLDTANLLRFLDNLNVKTSINPELLDTATKICQALLHQPEPMSWQDSRRPKT